MLRSFIALLKKLSEAYMLRKYTPYTRAELLRKHGSIIGDDCFIIPTSLGTEPYLVKIGNHVAIASGATFITHDGGCWVFRHECPDLQAFGPIIVEDNVLIGQNAIIFPNVRIGRNSIVGAGSVVINDIPPNSIAIGVPARPFGSLDKYRDKCLQTWAVQRPAGIEIESGRTWWTSAHQPANRAKLRDHLISIFGKELRPS